MCRSGLKAELGAFYPLLLLRPLEAERPEPGQLYSALTALQELATQAQLLVCTTHRSMQHTPFPVRQWCHHGALYPVHEVTLMPAFSVISILEYGRNELAPGSSWAGATLRTHRPDPPLNCLELAPGLGTAHAENVWGPVINPCLLDCSLRCCHKRSPSRAVQTTGRMMPWTWC